MKSVDTLIELMTIIAVVALLGTILTPALARTSPVASSAPAAVFKPVDLPADSGSAVVPAFCRSSYEPGVQVAQGAVAAISSLGLDVRDGGVIRGPRNRKRIALVFTGHEFAEGGETILKELERHQSKASFFLTGDFLRNPSFSGLIERMVKGGHRLGGHSDKHLLYCSWDKKRETLVTWQQFESDLKENQAALQRHQAAPLPYFLPPYEHHNQQIADWAQRLGLRLVNLTPGTRSAADYTGEADRNFVASREIFDSIIAKERQDPDGLSGFLLLLHLGAGPGRTDKFHTRFGELLDCLSGKGYKFVTVDELLGAQNRRPWRAHRQQ